MPLFVVDPADTSSTCPRCGAGLVEVGYRRLRCPNCGLEADRDTIAVLNIEGRALSKMGGTLASPTAPQVTDVSPNRWGEPVNRPKGTLRPLGRGGGQIVHPAALSMRERVRRAYVESVARPKLCA